MTKKETLDQVYANPEFTKEADSLIERIQQYQTRVGEPVIRENVLKIANQILESRIK